MITDIEALVAHDGTEDCAACRAQDLVSQVLVPAAAAWEKTAELPRFSLALHGAAGLLMGMLEDGVPREDIEGALARLLDDIESHIAEDQAIGGPVQGSA